MFTKKEKINSLGIVSGMFLTMIPFYKLFRFFKSYGFLTKTKHKAMAIFSVVGYYLSTIVFLIMFFVSLSLLFAILVEGAETEYNSFSDYDYGSLVVMLILMSITSIVLTATVIVNIVLGLSIKKDIDNDDSLEDTARYEIAKFAGVMLATIPFYIIIKPFLAYKVLATCKPDYSKLAVVAILMYYAGTLISQAFQISTFNSLAQYLVDPTNTELITQGSAFGSLFSTVSYIGLILLIVAGNMLNKSFEGVAQEVEVSTDSTYQAQF